MSTKKYLVLLCILVAAHLKLDRKILGKNSVDLEKQNLNESWVVPLRSVSNLANHKILGKNSVNLEKQKLNASSYMVLAPFLAPHGGTSIFLEEPMRSFVGGTSRWWYDYVLMGLFTFVVIVLAYLAFVLQQERQRRDLDATKIAELEQRIAAANEGLDIHCKICLESERNVAFIPCGHVGCCLACAPSVRSCPFCRIDIEQKLILYHP